MYQFPEVQNASKGIKNGERNAPARQEKNFYFFTSAEVVVYYLCSGKNLHMVGKRFFNRHVFST